MALFSRHKLEMVDESDALAGREEPIVSPGAHFVLGTQMAPPYPDNSALVHFALGCFWGAERIFWQEPGVGVTAVGYAGGYTKNPTYEEVCSGLTGHAETVRVVYDPSATSLSLLVARFFEAHDPTQYMGQGNDIGTQYRSAIYVGGPDELAEARRIATGYGETLHRAGYGAVTTEVELLKSFYFAEDYHQQYLAKNPAGYCGLSATGVSCPTGLLEGGA